MGYKYAKEVLTEWREDGTFAHMMPMLYKRRARQSGVDGGTGVSSSSSSSLRHRKTRSVSIGVPQPSGSTNSLEDAAFDAANASLPQENEDLDVGAGGGLEESALNRVSGLTCTLIIAEGPFFVA